MSTVISSLLLVTCCISFITSVKEKVDKYPIKFYDVVESINSTMPCNDDSSCPTWFYCNTETNRCQCGESYYEMITCDEATGRAAVSDCHCVTYDNETKETEVGLCCYNCGNATHKTLYDRVYLPLPKNPSELTAEICGQFNRTGTLCGQCAPGLSPFVLSYNLSCVECPDGNKNWWKFILAGFVPLTFFYMFIVVFNINITSSRLHGVVWFSQVVSVPAFARILVLTFASRPGYQKMLKVAFPLYSFWNLDFFHTIMDHMQKNDSK